VATKIINKNNKFRKLEIMKLQTGIWIDGKEAVVVTINGDSNYTKTIVSDIENKTHHEKESHHGTFKGMHHGNEEKKFDERKKHQIKNYLSKVIFEVKDANEIYVFGPSEMKKHLKSEIENDKLMIEKLKGVETADSMTTNQIVARVKEYFK